MNGLSNARGLARIKAQSSSCLGYTISALQYRHLISVPVNWASASAWLYKTHMDDMPKRSQAHQYWLQLAIDCFNE